MKIIRSTFGLLAAATVCTAAFAASHSGGTPMPPAASAPMGKQQSKMASCNADAKDMKGDERKAFMKDCLSAKKPMTQQDKMKNCNAEAKGKTGDDRKAFMKQCLSGSA